MWLVYPTEAQADAAQAAIWDAVKPTVETRDGAPIPDRITQRWATPRQSVEGWAIAAPPAPIPGIGGAAFDNVAFHEVDET